MQNKPGYTSQFCPLKIIDSNSLLPKESKDRKEMFKSSLVRETCKNYRVSDIGGLIADKKGKFFIHSSGHALNHQLSHEIRLDRDIAASINLSYCQLQ